MVSKLHLGCGANLIDGWLNTDVESWHPFVGKLDVRQKIPFMEWNFDYVFHEHLLEHLNFDEGSNLIYECFRVLIPGGRLRISTPDVAFLLRLVNPATVLEPVEAEYVDWACVVNELVPAHPLRLVNHFFRAWGHQFIWSRPLLEEALLRAGFGSLSWHEVGESVDPHLRGLENVGRMPPGFLQLETMTVEAVKPSNALVVGTCQFPEPGQDGWELRTFLERFVINERSVLEVGSATGGMLAHLATSLRPGGRVRSVSMAQSEWEVGELKQTVENLRSMGYDAASLNFNSTAAEALEWATESGPYDVVFIDGAHDYAGVKADWNNYRSLGKVVAFHDVGNQPGVIQLWAEIKTAGFKTEELVRVPGNFGIGVVREETTTRG